MPATAAEVAAHHPGGAGAVFTGDRGRSVTAMAEALARFLPDLETPLDRSPA